MESLIVVSKVKKFIKGHQGLNTSSGFFEPLNNDALEAIKFAVDHAKKMGRKTVMGRDFNFYKEDPKIEDALVVASKVKKMIKDSADMNTSSQVIEQLTLRVERVCLDAIKNAVNDKRKTVMDRDFVAPTMSTDHESQS